MKKFLVAALAAALFAVPGAAIAAAKGDGSTTAFRDGALCQPVPLKTPAISAGPIQVPGVSAVEVCAEWNIEANVVPTVTQYNGCGSPCLAVRVSKLNIYQDVKVELRYTADKQRYSVPVDPPGAGAGQDLQNQCIGVYDSTTSPDPCKTTITPPAKLRAKGAHRQIDMSWDVAKEFYGRDLAIQGYEIWRSDTGVADSFAQIATTEIASFSDTGLGRRQHHWYYVVAFDADGNRSASSEIVTATTR